ncbi:MAG: nucleoside-diphosphate sugar epimerase/dehydratase [Rhodospirillaceae bacterium]
MIDLRIPRIPPRGWIAFGHDIFMAAVSFPLALYLRVGDDMALFPEDIMIPAGAFFTVQAAVIFFFMGLYRGVWRYASINDLLAIAKAVSLAIAVFVVAMFIWVRLEPFPRSLFFIQWFILIGMLGGPRFIHRVIKDRKVSFDSGVVDDRRIPILLAGAGDEAELFIRALGQTDQAEYRVVGLVAERRGRIGQLIRGHEVLGTFDEIAQIVGRLEASGNRPRRIVLTRRSIDGAVVRSLLAESERLGILLSRLPRMTDFREGVSERLTLRPVAVEDLLGRPQTPLDRGAMANLIERRRVLITGAGGSIGGELARQIAKLNPGHLILLDHSEYALYQIDQELGGEAPNVPRKAVLADVRESDEIARLFDAEKPALVFHAAALKHVPLVEDNKYQGLLTNVLGTLSVANAARRSGAAAMVMVSTDKAVNPTSVMGMSKRLAEVACQAFDVESRDSGGTRFVTVRFGNVLGSTGSVVPLFEKQLAQGGPLTVTHPDMTRFFMTTREAVELVLSASALGFSSEADGRIFVLDMGEPVKILDLARQMIRLAGMEPDKDIAIEFTGIRPGEKLYEEIFHGDEAPVPTNAAGILLAAPRLVPLDDVMRALADLETACRSHDHAKVAAVVSDLVPEFTGSLDGAPPALKKRAGQF